MAIRLGRLAMVSAMRVKVDVSKIPKPPYTMPHYRYPKTAKYPKDAVIVQVDIKQEPLKPTKDWVGRNRKDLWTDEARRTAWQMITSGKSVEEIAKTLGRGEKATYQELCRLRRENGSDIQIIPRQAVYTPETDALIIRMHNAGQSKREIAEATGRTCNAIKFRITLLRKRGLITRDNRRDK